MSFFSADNLSINFGGIKAVDGVTFDVNKGEVFTIIGPNGAGKTTIFNLVSRIYQSTGGKLLFDGMDITNVAPHRIAALGIARTFQNIELFEHATLLQNLLLARHAHKRSGVFSELLPHHVSIDAIRARAPRGLILSGGPASVYADGAPKLRYAMACAAMTALLVVAFLAGRSYPHRPVTPPVTAYALNPEQILLVAVGDYLDRSQMALIELANANSASPLDISLEQERAQDLLSETRLYRQTALAMGATSLTGILDELERVLMDIAHAPSRLSPAELETFRGRLSAAPIGPSCA